MLSTKLNSDRKFLYLLGVITLAGFFLRLYGIGSESLTADEASALLRLKFSSFTEMLEGGVRPDGHPAFTQVLLWFWTKCFGWNEFSVRLPFVVFGTASIWLSGIIGRKWFSNTTGLTTAIGISFLQFPLMYSQLARPYAPGLFFTLLAGYFLGQFLNQKTVHKKQIVGFAIAASLAAYSHYFSLLITTLLAIAGIFFVAKEVRWRYLLACGIAVLLFLPHLSITLSQLKVGGIGGPDGWLGKPTPEFLMEHLVFIFNGSRGLLLSIFVVCGISAVLFIRKPNPFQGLAFALWLLPMIIGYIYSINRNPVLQDSVLLFGFPFLLIFIFSCLPDYNIKKWILVFPLTLSFLFLFHVTILNPYHLTAHFGRLKELVSTTINWQKKHSNQKVDVAYNVDADYFVDYYYNRFNVKRVNVLSTINNGAADLASFKRIIKNSTADYFVYGWSTKYSPLEILPIIRERFPYLIQKQEWYNSAIYIFSKTNSVDYFDPSKDLVFYSTNSLQNELIDNKKTEWSSPCKPPFVDSSASRCIRLDTTCIYSPLLKIKASELLKHPDNEIYFSTKVKLEDARSVLVLVIEFQRDGKQLFWNGRESTYQIDINNRNQWQDVYFGLRLPKNICLTDTVNFYCYAKDGIPLLLSAMKVEVLKGHSGIYGVKNELQ